MEKSHLLPALCEAGVLFTAAARSSGGGFWRQKEAGILINRHPEANSLFPDGRGGPASLALPAVSGALAAFQSSLLPVINSLLPGSFPSVLGICRDLAKQLTRI